jgi:hypothetical protein
MWPSAAALLVVTLSVLGVVHYRERPPDPREPHAVPDLAAENVTLAYAGGFAVSPDGRARVDRRR